MENKAVFMDKDCDRFAKKGCKWKRWGTFTGSSHSQMLSDIDFASILYVEFTASPERFKIVSSEVASK